MTPEELNFKLSLKDKPNPLVRCDANLLREIGFRIAMEVKPLKERIAVLEKKIENFRYCGVYATGLYHEMNVVTWDGSMWVCMKDTTQRPGLNGDWCLAVKHGRDGKDGKDAQRLPTAPRAYGAAS